MIWTDVKYLRMLSSRLPLFRQKDENTYNFRCPLCGDSEKDPTKTRGYCFVDPKTRNRLLFKCHNCARSKTFANFLRKLDDDLYRQYSVEKFKQKYKKEDKTSDNFGGAPTFVKPASRPPAVTRSVLDGVLTRVDSLPDDHEATAYLISRMIPRETWDDLYYIDDISKIVQLNEKYREKITGREPRLVIPFYDFRGRLTAVTCRALNSEGLRYVTIEIREGSHSVYGLDRIDTKKPVMVVEGPLDSKFLENAIAVGGSNLKKMISILPNNAVFIFDNEPRNTEVCKLYRRMIDLGRKIVIWPSVISEKDINAMIMGGMSIETLRNTINSHTFDGLRAHLEFNRWVKCEA